MMQREDNNTINNRHWGKHASIQMFIKHSGGSRGGAQALIEHFSTKIMAQEKKILLWDPFPWTQGEDEQHPHFLKGLDPPLNNLNNICLWCKMLGAESHLNAMLRAWWLIRKTSSSNTMLDENVWSFSQDFKAYLNFSVQIVVTICWGP